MADTKPPMILGVEMQPDAHGFHMRFGALWVQAEHDGAGSWYPYVGDHLVYSVCGSFEKCRLAIERELLAIRAAIPGACYHCGDVLVPERDRCERCPAECDGDCKEEDCAARIEAEKP